jgi:hypothetical protein
MDPNAGRPGYKETKVGWLPEEWECLRLEDAIASAEYGLSVKAAEEAPSRLLA